MLWTCGTRRHRSTAQRYAVAPEGVKPARSRARTTSGIPVDNCLIPGLAPC
jgi:hypothetical protein